MAWESWKDYRWANVWSDKHYAIDVQWRYKQDPIANKTFYSATALRVRNLDGYNYFYNASAKAGIGTITSNRKITTVNANISKGGSQTFNLTDISREINHNSDGTLTGQEYNLHGYFDAGLGGQYDTPVGGWKLKEITNQINSIDRRGPTINVSVNSVNMNSVQLKITSNMLTTHGSYSVNGDAWTGYTPPSQLGVSGGGTGYLTIGGLKPNTKYTIQIDCKRDYNGVWSNKASVTFTTSKPNAPVKGTVSVSSVTPTSAIFTANGFSFSSGATWGHYDFAKNHEDSWHNNGSNNVYSVTGLKPNTDYLALCHLVDNYGTPSGTASYSFKTPKPPAPTGGGIVVNDITPFTVSFSWSGFTANSLASISRYDVEVSVNGQGPIINVGLVNAYTITNLMPNTEYRVWVRAVDNYGSASAWVEGDRFTTLSDQAKVLIKENSTWKKAKVWVKSDGIWKKVKNIKIKTNNVWKDLKK